MAARPGVRTGMPTVGRTAGARSWSEAISRAPKTGRDSMHAAPSGTDRSPHRRPNAWSDTRSTSGSPRRVGRRTGSWTKRSDTRSGRQYRRPKRLGRTSGQASRSVPPRPRTAARRPATACSIHGTRTLLDDLATLACNVTRTALNPELEIVISRRGPLAAPAQGPRTPGSESGPHPVTTALARRTFSSDAGLRSQGGQGSGWAAGAAGASRAAGRSGSTSTTSNSIRRQGLRDSVSRTMRASSGAPRSICRASCAFSRRGT